MGKKRDQYFGVSSVTMVEVIRQHGEFQNKYKKKIVEERVEWVRGERDS